MLFSLEFVDGVFKLLFGLKLFKGFCLKSGFILFWEDWLKLLLLLLLFIKLFWKGLKLFWEFPKLFWDCPKLFWDWARLFWLNILIIVKLFIFFFEIFK